MYLLSSVYKSSIISSTESVRIPSVTKYDNAYLLSAAPCMRHIRPSRANAMPPHGAPYVVATIRNLYRNGIEKVNKQKNGNTSEKKLTPNMMHIIEPSDLRKESGKRFIVALTEFDGTSPIVAPLNHCARLQAIRSHLVNVTAHSIGNLWPITERQQILQMTRPQIGATFAHQFQIFLWKIF